MDIEKVAEAVQSVTRPIVTISLTIALIIGFLHGQVSGDAFLSVVGIIVAFWFKDRESAKDAATTKAADKLVRQIADKDPSSRNRVL